MKEFFRDHTRKYVNFLLVGVLVAYVAKVVVTSEAQYPPYGLAADGSIPVDAYNHCPPFFRHFKILPSRFLHHPCLTIFNDSALAPISTPESSTVVPLPQDAATTTDSTASSTDATSTATSTLDATPPQDATSTPSDASSVPVAQ